MLCLRYMQLLCNAVYSFFEGVDYFIRYIPSALGDIYVVSIKELFTVHLCQFLFGRSIELLSLKLRMLFLYSLLISDYRPHSLPGTTVHALLFMKTYAKKIDG